MAKHDSSGGPRICQGCGEWFDAVGAEKTCPNEGCADLASRIMKESKAHEAEVKKNYEAGWIQGDARQMANHGNWRADHPPRRENERGAQPRPLAPRDGWNAVARGPEGVVPQPLHPPPRPHAPRDFAAMEAEDLRRITNAIRAMTHVADDDEAGR